MKCLIFFVFVLFLVLVVYVEFYYVIGVGYIFVDDVYYLLLEVVC